MQEISYQFPMFERLQPHSEWRGGRMTNIDLLTLEDAARMASKHSGEEVTPADFLRAAGRGEITLRAIVHRTAKVHAHDGGVLFNKGGASENIVPAGSIPTLPLTACQHLAATGRASWRTFDGFEKREGTLMRYTKGMLADDEPDFETVPDDCRVVGYDVHALADAFCAPEDAPQAATPAPVVAESANDAPVLPFKKAALVAAHVHEWPTIESDISDAATNGLAAAAKAGKRGWWEEAALIWARANGKLISAAKTADSLAQAMHNMGNLPSRKHTLQG